MSQSQDILHLALKLVDSWPGKPRAHYTKFLLPPGHSAEVHLAEVRLSAVHSQDLQESTQRVHDKVREKLGLPPRTSAVGRPCGLVHAEDPGFLCQCTAREIDLLDIVYCMADNDPTPEQRASFELKFKVAYRQPKRTSIVNVSQGLLRQPWKDDDAFPTLTTSTKIYAMSAEKIISPAELFQMNGWDGADIVPAMEDSEIPETKLSTLAGNGMAVPAIALVCASLISALHGQPAFNRTRALHVPFFLSVPTMQPDTPHR